MDLRRVYELALAAVLALALSLPVAAGTRNCTPRWKCQPIPTAAPTPVPSPPAPSPASTARPSAVAPSPTPSPSSSPYTFDDEFSALDPRWRHHYSCCGTGLIQDPSLATVSGGYLTFTAEHRSTGWAGYLLDTKDTWTQLYGYFEARMKIPVGKGLWPAFWLYPGSGTNEIDTMEVCANPPGTNGGNDVTKLHTTVHFADGSQAGKAVPTGDLSGAFHTYGVDWRPGVLRWYLDGALVFTYSGANVPAVAMPLVINLGVGGSWCGAPDATTPSPSAMSVDWVRVRQ